MKLTDTDREQGVLKFAITDREGLLDEKFEVSIKYWEGRASFNKWHTPHDYFQNSGAYIFCPADGQYAPLPYTKLVNSTKIGNDTFISYLGSENDDGLAFK